MKNNKTKKVLSVVLAGSMLLAMGITSFATETTETDTVENQRGYFRDASENRGRMGSNRGRMEAPGVRLAIGDRLLDEMVESGLIYERDVDAIETFLEEQRDLSPDERVHPEAGEGPLEFLIDEGVISQETADDIVAGIEVLRDQRRDEFIESIIDKGILTEAEMEDVLDFMEDCKEEREEIREELSEMTWAERREYIDAHRDDFQGPVEKMLDEGLISDSQAEAIRDIFPGRGGNSEQRGHGNFHPNFDRGAKNGVPFGNRTGARFTPLMDVEEL